MTTTLDRLIEAQEKRINKEQKRLAILNQIKTKIVTTLGGDRYEIFNSNICDVDYKCHQGKAWLCLWPAVGCQGVALDTLKRAYPFLVWKEGCFGHDTMNYGGISDDESKTEPEWFLCLVNR